MINLTLSDEERLHEILKKIKERSEAEEVHLITKAGVIIETTEEGDKTTIAALLAGNVSASEAVSKLKGNQELKSVYSESEKEGIYMELVGGELIIAVVYNPKKTALGAVKLWTRKFKPEIEEVIEKAKGREPQVQLGEINVEIGELFN